MSEKVKSIKELSESDIVKYAVENVMGLSEPDSDITKFLNNIGELSKLNPDALEKRMTIFIAWQNYFGEQLVLADAIKSVAETQAQYFWGNAIKTARGTINEKKELALSDINWVNASNILEKAKAGYNAIKVKFDNCDRSFRLVSRILTKRLGIKEY